MLMYCYSHCVFILIRTLLTSLSAGTLTPPSQHPLLCTPQVCCLGQCFCLSLSQTILFFCVCSWQWQWYVMKKKLYLWFWQKWKLILYVTLLLWWQILLISLQQCSSYVGYKWSGGRVMITIILSTCQGNCLMSYVSDGAHVTKLWCDL